MFLTLVCIIRKRGIVGEKGARCDGGNRVKPVQRRAAGKWCERGLGG